MAKEAIAKKLPITIEEIADKVGVSEDKVRSVLNKAGIDLPAPKRDDWDDEQAPV